MEKKTYLNNTSLEDLSLIKNDIKNLNDYYSKTFKQSQNNAQKPNEEKEEEEESKQKEPQSPENNNNNNINKKSPPIKDSRELSSPIINPEYFYNFIKSETKSKTLSSLKLSSFNYKTLQETFTGLSRISEEIYLEIFTLPS